MVAYESRVGKLETNLIVLHSPNRLKEILRVRRAKVRMFNGDEAVHVP